MTDSTPSSGFVAVLQGKLQQWASERAQLMSQVAEIDAKLRRVAAELGVDPSELPSSPGPALPEKKVDMRRVGSMVEYVLKLIEASEDGYTRAELKEIVKKHPDFGPKLTRNENGFYNVVKRALNKEELVARGDRLYTPSRAPSEAALEAAKPQNVTLFPAIRGGETM